MICIYHKRDLDGLCCAAIVKSYAPSNRIYTENGMGTYLPINTFIGWDYGDPIPVLEASHSTDNELVIADISLPLDALKKYQLQYNVVYIDHHKSAIVEYNAAPISGVMAVLDTSKAACELTWNHFFPNKIMPKSVWLLGVYDSWREKDSYIWENEVMPFQMWTKSMCRDYMDVYYQLLENRPVDITPFIEEGKIIRRYQQNADASKCMLYSFPIQFAGFKAICLNAAAGSQTFKSVSKDYDIMIAFTYNGKLWTISLYTEKPYIDVSDIAKQFGGGGHKGAAGFTTKDIKCVLGI
jgi:uncharacterized protein